MSIISLNVATNHLSFSKSISHGNHHPKLLLSFSNLSLDSVAKKQRSNSSVIRMGGGPRTYPGGVSKWQWKRMQAKKSKQLLKARLARERHIYQMRKRAELKAAVSELERPWEPVHKPPTLFSLSADEQLKVLADRFQKPGGLDLWSHRDGPQLFHTHDGVPSARFFPKGVVHSVKPYGKVSSLLGDSDPKETGDSENGGKWGRRRKSTRNNSRRSPNAPNLLDSSSDRPHHMNGGNIRIGNANREYSRHSESDEVYDMLLGMDGSYVLEA